jgi:2-keto-4-pentenoate hydratase/2-oxohepta-3-ene-1,7-dioic acid hydratase in catechol pathway
MKICVFDAQRIGIVNDGFVVDISSLVPGGSDQDAGVAMNWLIRNWSSSGPAVSKSLATLPKIPLSEVKLRSPVQAPRHVFAAPANYQKHIGELGAQAVTKASRTAREQGFFLKAPGSITGIAEGIVLPALPGRRFDHESELAVIIGTGGKAIPRGEALSHVFGYSCLVDLTMRIEPGHREEERSMRKSFSTFTPIGPWIVTADEVPNPQLLSNKLWVNGNLKQQANTKDMIVAVDELIELISAVIELSPGDVIATGTPEGVGPVVQGDNLEIEIENVGRMGLLVR